MIEAIIIDDEQDARFMIRNLLDRYFNDKITVVAEADDVPVAVEIIKKYKPALVFIDIKMHQGTGFDVLEQLDKIDFEVIFVTAYDQFAVKAFQFSAVGYLMKPIKISELKSVVARVEEKVNQKKTNTRMKVLIENYGDDRQIKKLVVSSMSGFKVFSIEEIIRIEGDGNYSNFVTMNEKKVTSSKTLGEYESLLTEFGFFRIHQSTLINLRHVRGYSRGENCEVEMTDGASLSVSRHRKAAFVKYFI